MSVEQKIIDNSKDAIAALAPRAAKAVLAPDTGITVLIPGARAVIRDCAMVTVKYLPIMLFANMTIESLKGKFTKQEITDLYFRGIDGKQNVAKQLLMLMYIDAQYYNMSKPNPGANQNTDIYNDYDNYVESKTPVDITASIVRTICEAFDAK